MKFTAEQIRAMADTIPAWRNYEQVAAMLRQAAADAEFRQFWESSGEDATRTPKEQTK